MIDGVAAKAATLDAEHDPSPTSLVKKQCVSAEAETRIRVVDHTNIDFRHARLRHCRKKRPFDMLTLRQHERQLPVVTFRPRRILVRKLKVRNQPVPDDELSNRRKVLRTQIPDFEIR